ncbi:hypothetical protein C882_1584 [Caenispirillum salinarum AK4]|uniref:N-acetyltransferase domain-containing protein n=1 Tax=Caenispirillum salinarum AK4 TaxID=1238182 RepID=K9HX58_9PROT|nr:GNAT family N-acetyltransferase [Caenispirillum salinarum]EKV32746.1 hypothetical protein C882_1584 [Caenispirillum salinarum AK4]
MAAETATAAPGLTARLRATVAELGGPNAVLYWISRALGRAGGIARLHRYVIVLQPVPERPLLKPHRGRSIAVEPLSRDDPRLFDLPLTRAVMDYRFDQGALCLGAVKDGRVIGCLWLCLGPFDEDEVRCRYVREPEGAASWDFDVYVHPDHRTGFAFGRLWDAANGLLRERGARFSASRISAFNAASLKSHAALGAAAVGRATFLRLGPRLQVMVSDLAPRVNISWRDDRPPRLLIPCPPPAQGGENKEGTS